MTTPKQALEGLIEAVTRDADEPGGRGISGYTSARLSDAKAALASLQGEDAVERVARADFARRCRAYLDDMPSDGRHSDAAGSNAYELIEEAIEHCATGLVPDEAAIRADEREKCAKVAVARSDAVMAEAEAAHDDDNYDLYERLECEAGNYMDLAAAIRSGES